MGKIQLIIGTVMFIVLWIVIGIPLLIAVNCVKGILLGAERFYELLKLELEE